MQKIYQKKKGCQGVVSQLEGATNSDAFRGCNVTLLEVSVQPYTRSTFVPRNNRLADTSLVAASAKAFSKGLQASGFCCSQTTVLLVRQFMGCLSASLQVLQPPQIAAEQLFQARRTAFLTWAVCGDACRPCRLRSVAEEGGEELSDVSDREQGWENGASPPGHFQTPTQRTIRRCTFRCLFIEWFISGYHSGDIRHHCEAG